MVATRTWILFLGAPALLALSGCRTKEQNEPEASTTSAAGNDVATADPTAQSKSAKPLKPTSPGATHSGMTGRSMARNERLPWRMPTMAELEAAVKRGIQSDANPAFGKEYLTLTWSSETSSAFGPEAYVLDLRNTNQFLLGKGQKMRARCIRPLHH